jgi:ribonuclease BN (tRNA processing enzyme)
MFAEGELVAKEENERLEKFCRNADLLIYDTQYTQDEYNAGKKGWGHSSIETAIDIAKRNRVKRLALFHHDPLRSDDELDKLSKLHCNPFFDSKLEVFFAREGKQIIL